MKQNYKVKYDAKQYIVYHNKMCGRLRIHNINSAKDRSKPDGESLDFNQSDQVAGLCATMCNRRSTVMVRLRPNSQDKATSRVVVTSKMGKRLDWTGL
jgi:hypothetical protein